MLTLKSNPVGIDIPIQKAQTKLYSILMREWGITDELYECYGRCYRNQSERGYIAEIYTVDNEYKEVYFNDSLYAISFFSVSPNITHTTLSKANVSLIFFADLKKLSLKDRFMVTIQHRADEELRRQVMRALGAFSYSLSYEGYELGIENVLSDYPGTRRDDRLKFIDMHPYHCFRLNYSLIFDPNKIC